MSPSRTKAAPKRVRLTPRTIEAFRYGGKGNARDVRWDTDRTAPPGFGVRVYPSGRKAFVLAYRNAEGRKRLLTLGDFPSLTLREARRRARDIVATVEGGGDPLEDKKKAREAMRVSELVDLFLEDAARRLKPKTLREYRRQLETHVKPRWGTRTAKGVRRSDVARLHAEIGRRAPTLANRTVAAVASMFRFAAARGYVPEGMPNPAHGIEKFEETKRDRWVKAEELPRLVEAINREPNPFLRAYLWLLLLTGCRKEELLQARWDDVDWERRELRIPDTKSGRVHYVPLSEAALTLLRSVPRMEANPYIIVGRKHGAHLVNPDKAWRRIRREAGLEDVRLHDLRRTVGSWLATHGASLPLIGKILNHSTPSTTAIYARLSQDPARTALEEHGRRILEAAKGLQVINGGKDG